MFALENKNHPTPMKIKHIALSLALMATDIASANADRLVIKGSDTLGAKLVPQLAEQFKAQHPGTTFDIAAEGSTTGIAAIISTVPPKSACRAGVPRLLK